MDWWQTVGLMATLVATATAVATLGWRIMLRLQREIAEFRDELRADMAKLRDGLRAEMAKVRTDLGADIVSACLIHEFASRGQGRGLRGLSQPRWRVGGGSGGKKRAFRVRKG